AARTFPVTVTKAGSTTGVTVKPKHPKAGHKVKLKVTVAGANGIGATGEVTIKVNGKKITVALVNGTATAKVAGLDKGTHKAKVTYDGDAHLTGSSDQVKFTVS